MQNQRKERGFKGIWIPAELWLTEGLNLLEKILFLEIDSLNNGKGCFASNAYFANFMNKSETTISIAISKLKKLKLVAEKSFDGR